MKYNWQQKDWTNFKYQLGDSEDQLFEFSERTGRISGFLSGLTKEAQTETMIEFMVSEAIKTSEIEGEYLNRNDVMSSIKNNLGLLAKIETVNDKRAEGIAELMIDVRVSYAQPLSEEKLFDWHRMLMKGSKGITTGYWRTHDEPMQVVSGALGKEKIHFEAPASKNVPDEMEKFMQWFNETAPGGTKEIKIAVVRSAIAHLYFESIHPFEDGNGRIGRAISEKALSQGVKRPVLLSLSKSIESNKKAYYNQLQKAQKGNEITPWVNYFVSMALDAQIQAEKQIEFTLKKAKLFDNFKNQLNERQLKAIKRMLEQGPNGFEGGMNARKYISITGTSKATATRDLQDLSAMKLLIPKGGGRSVSYDINLNFDDKFLKIMQYWPANTE